MNFPRAPRMLRVDARVLQWDAEGGASRRGGRVLEDVVETRA